MASNKLVLLGVTQEQHAERCSLFAQWKEFDWPILHDPINLLGSRAVPLVSAIDEMGIVQSTKPTPDWVRDTFISNSYSGKPGPVATIPSLEQLVSNAKTQGDAASHRALGDAAILWHRTDPDLAVDAYESAVQQESTGINHFRLGVALRRRHETAQHRPTDFSEAVRHWTQALEMDPNQYIWRRRIQQYGPRLDKPYPFYDWVPLAKQEILARGEEPFELKVALSGAEVAQPSREFQVPPTPVSPDPSGKITRDAGQYVELSAVAVPAQVAAGQNIRLHLEFKPTRATLWNNESEPLTVWLNPRPGWKARQTLIRHADVPDSAESDEIRRVEVELQSAKNAKSQAITGYALYYVCDRASGTCLFRRQDFVFQANIR